MLPDLASLRRLVRDAARAELLPRFADVVRRVKTDGSLVTAADHAMQQRMQRELAARWPAYAFLGEEMGGDEQERLTREATRGLWCLDPLDGTSNFAAGIPFFAVSLALLVDGRPLLGLVYDPVRGECFTARRGEGVRLDDAVLGAPGLQPAELERAIACVDFKRLEKPLAGRLGAQPPYGSQRNFGSSSLEWCWLADGRFHLYLHGGQKLWDYAAGWLILSEAGGYSATLDGEDVFALGLAPRSVVAARDSRLFSSWQAWLRAPQP
jgi:myo-inositol-1(or 4)-monophosphatase